MAINFEAANMAGYNNPKIEVFEAHSGDTKTLDETPSKTDLLNCIRSGAIPFIMLNVIGVWQILLPCSAVLDDPSLGGTAISFTFKGTLIEGGALTEARIVYLSDDKPPVFTFTNNA